MRISRTLLFALILFFSCRTRDAQNLKISNSQPITRTYARSVGDSFSIYLSLPEDYNSETPTKYPVVYLSDANFTFEMTASAFRNYAAVGLLPEVILVGIGYRDLREMDSLRDRDYTYPVAVPEHEMEPSGGANRFLVFINNELIPQMERTYRCDAAHRILMGHSLGGYFVTYALLQQLTGGNKSFSGFIAASPSLNYNHYYLLQQMSTLPGEAMHNRKFRLYATYGGLEDAEDADVADMEPNANILARLDTLLKVSRPGTVAFKGEIFSNLAHMDMPIPSYLKGLAFVLGDEQ